MYWDPQLSRLQFAPMERDFICRERIQTFDTDIRGQRFTMYKIRYKKGHVVQLLENPEEQSIEFMHLVDDATNEIRARLFFRVSFAHSTQKPAWYGNETGSSTNTLISDDGDPKMAVDRMNEFLRHLSFANLVLVPVFKR